ncbi:transcriptional regulator [Kribbella sp. NPDC026611]|uniref:transcriptional regulator n=1 Tax=Kribbella sp. NPDC026611 TaxID=3154911 RepID=UPI0033DAF4E5
MSRTSDPELLVLHAVRLLGVADDQAVANRFALDLAITKELLLDNQAFGWITWSEFAGIGGWSLTAAGKAQNERLLAAELTDATVHAVHEDFLPFNARLQAACTRWQLRPTQADPLAFNDHTDPAWDAEVLEELTEIGQALKGLAWRLTEAAVRFDGYDRRFANALDRAHAGETAWIDSTSVDSCHRVWFELHEDLVATLGITRGA